MEYIVQKSQIKDGKINIPDGAIILGCEDGWITYLRQESFGDIAYKAIKQRADS